jgi:hypothetical protein
MLTVFAWMVFIPAVIWNFVFFAIAFGEILGDRKFYWANKRNARDALLSLAVLFIPGVYLFGVF